VLDNLCFCAQPARFDTALADRHFASAEQDRAMNQSLCARHLEAAALPLIDIAGLFSPDLAERTAVAERIGAACREIGFFCVANHGVDPALQQAVFELARAFFSQPEAGKRALDKVFSNANRGYEPLRGQVLEAGAPADLKEGFYIGEELAEDDPRVLAGRFNHGANQWPTELADFRPTMERYRDAMNALAARLMGAIALSLQLPEEHFAGFCRDSMSTLRLLHYPPQPTNAAPGEKGCGAHTDFGGLTLLLQDENPGLQVWVNMSGRERYSVPFFFSGNPDHLVECLPTCLAPGESPRYPAVTVEEHHREMYRRTYG